jgi:Kef-type K+ transport system membrane component KefB
MEEAFLLEIALILVFTKVFGLLTRKIDLPQVVGALLAGILLGPTCFKLINPSDLMNTLSSIGVIILMFSAGMETNLTELRKSLKASLIIAGIGVIVPLAGGFLLSRYYQANILRSVFIGVILTATSVSITVETLHELGKLQTKSGTIILGAAVIDDILGIIILTIIIGLGHSGDYSVLSVGLVLLKIAAFFVFALVVGWLAFKLFSYLYDKWGTLRRLSIFSLAFCFFMSFMAEQFGVADITGAYFAGLVLCGNKFVYYVEERAIILSYLFFSPIFFASIGLKTSLEGFSASVLMFSSLLLLIAVASKIIGCGLGAKICGYTSSESLQIGVGMISRGEVALIVANKGIAANLMDPLLFSGVIIVVIITTLITPLLLKIVYKENPPPPAPASG